MTDLDSTTPSALWTGPLPLAQHADESLVCFDAARTAAELRGYATRIESRMREVWGELRGAQVLVDLADRYDAAAALLAVWRMGAAAAFAPHTRRSVHERIESLSACRGRLVAGDADGSAFTLRVDDLREGAAEARPASSGSSPADWRPEAEAVAVWTYTSGSVGQPRAEAKLFRQLLAEVEVLAATFVADDLDAPRCYAAVPVQHIYGLLFGMLLPLISGGSFNAKSPLLPADVADALRRARAEVFISVPAQLRAMPTTSLGNPSEGPSLIFSSGAPLPVETAQLYAEAGRPITEVFGSTETGGIAWRRAPELRWLALRGVELALDEVELALDEVEGNESAGGADMAPRGRLCVRSPWLVDPHAPWTTSDRVALDPASPGHMRLLGRTDGVVKVGARRIDLEEIRAWLESREGVVEARVWAVESDGLRGVELRAVVVGTLEGRALRAEMLEDFDAVTVPRTLRVVSELPRNAMGKVSREALDELYARRPPKATRTGLLRRRSEVSEDGQRAAWTVEVGPDHPHFEGHFVGHPILPGVVQLQQMALEACREQFSDLGAFLRLGRVKFKAPILPGARLVLSLSRKSAREVRYTIVSGEHSAGEGALFFAEPG